MPLRSFKTILGVDIDLYCMALLIEIASFIRLRYTQPDRPRQYRVPVEGTIMTISRLPVSPRSIPSPPLFLHRLGYEYTCIYLLPSKEVCGEEAEVKRVSRAAASNAS